MALAMPGVMFCVVRNNGGYLPSCWGWAESCAITRYDYCNDAYRVDIRLIEKNGLSSTKEQGKQAYR